MEDSRKKIIRAHVNWFRAVYTEFLKDNKGFASPLDYIDGVYQGEKEYWAKIARRAGHKCIRRGETYFFEA